MFFVCPLYIFLSIFSFWVDKVSCITYNMLKPPTTIVPMTAVILAFSQTFEASILSHFSYMKRSIYILKATFFNMSKNSLPIWGWNLCQLMNKCQDRLTCRYVIISVRSLSISTSTLRLQIQYYEHNIRMQPVPQLTLLNTIPNFDIKILYDISLFTQLSKVWILLKLYY